MNDWIPTNYTSFANTGDTMVNQLVVDPSVSGDLFVGVCNSQNGASVYNYNGSTWNNLSGPTPPWGTNYNNLQKIFFYSSGGGTDSVFVIVGNSFNVAPYQIWKSGKNTPGWSLVLTVDPGVDWVSDAIVYNDSIFFTTYNSSALEGYVYKCTKGSDTLRTHSTPGITDQTNSFNSFGIHNGSLYVGGSNWSNGGQLFKYNSQNDWTSISADGFGFGSDMYSINKTYSFKNKMWVECTVQHGSFPQNRTVNPHNSILGGPISTIVFKSDDGINFTQSSPSGFYEYNNYGGEWNFASLGNYLYCGGPNYSTYGGQIYRLAVPSASFSGSIGTTNVCQSTVENFTNTSGGASTYKWYVDGSLYSTQPNPSFTYSVVHTFTFALVATSADGTLSDSITIIKNVNAFPVIASPTSPTVCAGTLVNYGTSISVANPPYSVVWSNGTDVFTTDTFQYTLTTSTIFTVTVTDALGCTNTNTHPLNAISSTDLSGHVTTPLGADVNNGFVYVFKHQPGNAGLDTVTYTSLNPSGIYLHSGLDAGNYLIKVLPDETDFPDAVPTYYGGAFQWDSAAVYTHGCSVNDIADIQIIESDPATGNGAVSGYIIEGLDFGGNKLHGGITHPNIPFAPGGPLKGVDVKLGKNPGGGIQARTMSDSTGFYVFDSLPPGGYKIYVDIPNLPMDSTREITIAASDSSVQNNYFADSASIYINTNFVGIYSSAIAYQNKFIIYPNPAKDHLFLKFELDTKSKVGFELTNTLGNIIRQESPKEYNEGVNIFDLNVQQLNLNNGVYFLSIIEEGKKYTQRIIIIN